MNRLGHHADASANADRLTRFRALVDGWSARAQQLRTLHEQYKALQTEETSAERRDKVMQIVQAEIAILDDSLRIHEQIKEFLRVQHELLGAHTPQVAAPPPKQTPSAPDTRE